jgi:hypothetical protein
VPDASQQINTEQQPLPDLSISQYNHWRDWLFNLQLGYTELKNEKDSHLFGMAAHLIGQSTILELRENRKRDEQPYIIHTDEKTDEQVLLEASPEDRNEAFVNATFKQLRGWIAGETKEERQYYPTAVLALGSALLGTDTESIKGLVLEKIDSSNLGILSIHGDMFRKALDKTSEITVNKLIDYLKFSQTQMTNNETYFLRTGLKEPPPLGSSPLVLGDQMFEFEGQNIGGTSLTDEDENVLIPLLAANHRSRQDMVEQAKETAHQLFNKPVNEINNPPSWWLEGENLEALSSKDILIYAPFPDNNMGEKLPKVFEEIYKSSHDRGGWFLIEVQKQKGPWLLTGEIARLNN